MPDFNRSGKYAPGMGIDAPLERETGRTALHLAIERDDKETFVRLLRAHANPNQADKNGCPPLFEAVRRGKKDFIDILSRFGADMNFHIDDSGYSALDVAVVSPVDAVDMIGHLKTVGVSFAPDVKTGRTALHTAVETGRADLLDYLTEQGLFLEERMQGKTPMHLAAAAGEVRVLQKLAGLGADPAVLDFLKRTPMHFAVQEGRDAAVDFLLAQESARRGLNLADSHDETSLMIAAGKNMIAAAEKMIAAGAEVNKIGNNKIAALHVAVTKGHVVMARMLLQHGADAGKAVKFDPPLTHLIHEKDYAEMLKALTENGANVNATNSDGYTALRSACEMGNSDKIKALLKAGADPNLPDRFGVYPLFSFMQSYIYRYENKSGILEMLLDAGASPDGGGRQGSSQSGTPLHLAAAFGRLDAVKLLIRHGAKVDILAGQTERTPLLEAAANGHSGVARFLLESGADPLKTDMMAYGLLHFAAGAGPADLVEFILDKTKTDINAQSRHGRTPLHQACVNGKWKEAGILLRRGARLDIFDDEGSTALHRAILSSAPEDLIEAFGAFGDGKVDWNIGKKGSLETPLHLAARQGKTGAVEKLLARGAFPFAADKYGKMPLHVAILHGQEAMAAFLLEDMKKNRIHPDQFRDKEGLTFLHYAVKAGNKGLMQMLFDAGADPNARDLKGNTPLHAAAYAGTFQAVDMLVDKMGADVALRNHENLSPEDIAIRTHHEVCLAALARGKKEKKEPPPKKASGKGPKP